MTKWNLPEGRRPLTDEDMAALTRRLADTAIEHSELYQAAKRDAEEAEAYAASLESDLNAMTELLQKSRAANVALEAKLELADAIISEGADRIEELEAKLRKEIKDKEPVERVWGDNYAALLARLEAVTQERDHAQDVADKDHARAERAEAALATARWDALEEAAAACEAQKVEFLSTEYATNQPFSSHSELFACGVCAAAIRALAAQEDAQ